MRTQPSYHGQTPILAVAVPGQGLPITPAIVLAANANERWAVDMVEASYASAPGAGDWLLTIALVRNGASVVWTKAFDGATGTRHSRQLRFARHMLMGDLNTDVTITLTTTEFSANGYLNVLYH